jgi:hypothetical protein
MRGRPAVCGLKRAWPAPIASTAVAIAAVAITSIAAPSAEARASGKDAVSGDRSSDRAQSRAGSKPRKGKRRAHRRKKRRAIVRNCAAGKRRARRLGRDPDRDGLSNSFERLRSKTKLRRRDTDRDRLSDRFELCRSHTNPRKRDTDGDGYSDRVELKRGSNPLKKKSVPRKKKKKRRKRRRRQAAPAPGATPGLIPRFALGCQPGATNVTSSAQARSEVAAGRHVCVVAAVGSLDLSGLRPGGLIVIGTAGAGDMGYVNLRNAANLVVRGRARNVDFWNTANTVLEHCLLGGSAGARTSENLIIVREGTQNATIRDCEIGWTVAGSGGNNGYGLRFVEGSGGGGSINNVRVERNLFHHIAADAIQGFGTASNVVIDRNEIGYVGAEPGSNEHSDNIQAIGHGPNLQITNNWIHHQGYFDVGAISGNAGAMYVHGGDPDSMLIENNLFENSRGRVEITGLGTGGRSISNLTVRRNTFRNLGEAFTGFPGFEWDATSGSNNVVTRNIAVDPDGGFAMNGSAGTFSNSANLFGSMSLVGFDAQGNCTSASCNPAGQEPIGYRKPALVHW